MNALVTANFDTASLNRPWTEFEMSVDYRPIGEREGRLPTPDLKAVLTEVEALIVGYEGISPDVLDAAPDLEVIACARGGPDANVDIDQAPPSMQSARGQCQVPPSTCMTMNRTRWARVVGASGRGHESHLTGATAAVVDRHSTMLMDGLATLFSGGQPTHSANELALEPQG